MSVLPTLCKGLLLMLTLGPLLPAASWLGPPAVCHPIAIGAAKSLPWTATSWGFDRDKDYDLSRLVPDTLALLDGSTSAFVHMETLRRAVIYLGDDGGRSASSKRAHDKAWRHAEAQRLVAALERRTAPVAGDGKQVGALDWLDLGYARTALAQMGLPFAAPAADKPAAPDEPGAAAASHSGTLTAAELIRGPLAKAAELAPQDGALHLGISIALFDGPGRDEARCLEHLDRALSLSDDPEGLLAKNLLGTMGKFLGATTHDDLAKAVRERRQRA